MRPARAVVEALTRPACAVIAKVSVPALHSAAAMLRLAEMDYTGANRHGRARSASRCCAPALTQPPPAARACACSIFIRVLLDKKYALPYRVVDALVHHFLRFQSDPRAMPVLWFQARARARIGWRARGAGCDPLTRAVAGRAGLPDIRAALQGGHLVGAEGGPARAVQVRVRPPPRLLSRGRGSAHGAARGGGDRHQAHAKVTPEIRRELQHAVSRDVESGLMAVEPEAR